MNDLTVLGCCAGSPHGDAAASGYLVQVAGRRLLVDCGPGVVAAATARDLLADIDAVLVSHRHADHCADLVALAYHRRFPTVLPPLPLYAPTGFGEVLDGLDAVWGIPTLPDLKAPLQEAFDLHEVEPGVDLTLDGVDVRTHRTLHPVPTMALRFPSVGLAYTADAGFTPGLVDFCRGARLLVAEATYRQLPPDGVDDHGHMDGTDAGELAARAQAERLLLTHFADPDDAAATARDASDRFAGPIDIAEPGYRMRLGVGLRT